MRKDLNVSRRLRRMLKASGLPLAGKAHWLRMRYVQLTHVLLMLQGQCTRGRIVMAMRDLLEGWGDTEEENADVGGYQHHAAAECHRRDAIADRAMGLGPKPQSLRRLRCAHKINIQ